MIWRASLRFDPCDEHYRGRVCLNNRGYAVMWDRKRKTASQIARFILDCPEGSSVDHINGDKLDNRRTNLRICSHAENIRNRPAMPRNRWGNIPTSAFKGVSRYQDKWRATIKFNYRTFPLGLFETEAEAARAYDAKARELHGEFASLNFPLTALP